jgi:hypothetical protein
MALLQGTDKRRRSKGGAFRSVAQMEVQIRLLLIESRRFALVSKCPMTPTHAEEREGLASLLLPCGYIRGEGFLSKVLGHASRVQGDTTHDKHDSPSLDVLRASAPVGAGVSASYLRAGASDTTLLFCLTHATEGGDTTQ